MSALLGPQVRKDEELALAPKLQQLHGTACTKRIEELEAIVAGLRAALEDAEAALRRERARTPEIGDFVRCPLTNFFGRVTRVVPRPHGRPWVEIVPYLTRDYPGHRTMDLYDSWELIDPPTEDEEPRPAAGTSLKLPSTADFDWQTKPHPDEQLADEIELLLSDLSTLPDKTMS